MTGFGQLAADLRASAEQLQGQLHQLDQAREALRRERFSAADGSRSVDVTVDGTGEILEVRLDEAWRKRLTPTMLPKAVTGAFEAARQKGFEAAQRRYAEFGARQVADSLARPADPPPARSGDGGWGGGDAGGRR
jgi:DNA-binding protein YbaB